MKTSDGFFRIYHKERIIMKKKCFVVGASIGLAAISSQPLLGCTESVPLNFQETVDETMTFDEMVNRICIEQNKSPDEVISEMVEIERSNRKDLKKSPGAIDTKNEILASLRAATYRTLTIPIPAMTGYAPAGIQFYHKSADYEGSQMTCVQIMNISLNRYDSSRGITKQFAGTVYLNLVDAQTIDWIVNGDFFDNGTTTVGGTVGAGVEGTASVSLSVSYASNHFSYYNKSGRYYMPRR